MERKYYTPTIEEFYVGFEYETDYLNDGKWIKREFSIDMASVFFDYYYKDGSETECRVKLLDREDIESLGWEMERIIIEDDDENDTYSDGFTKYLDDGTWFDLAIISDKYFYIHKKWYRNSVTQISRTVFYGTIKNKSELRKLMIQLGIK